MIRTNINPQKYPLRGKFQSGRCDYDTFVLPGLTLSSFLLSVLNISFLISFYVGVTRQNHHHLSSLTISSPVTQKNISPKLPDYDGQVPTINSFQDLTPSQIHPQAGPSRYIVSPPSDSVSDSKTSVTLVTCTTSVGYLHIVVHSAWAPLGAERFLQMVTSGYFSTRVALMRCVKGFLCQFGIAGDPAWNKPYVGKGKSLKDDPNWLPEGPTHRTNELGVKRFAKGYLAYAGAGANSRSNQLIVALKDNERLGGGSPWEVPWGEVVGDESFKTLDNIYTGYGEKGPSQGRLSREGSSEGVKKDFPELDYILGCIVVDSI